MILTTRRLTVRPIARTDADALYRVFSHPRVFDHFGNGVRSRNRVARWVKRTVTQWNDHGTGDLAICIDDTPIGSMIIHPNSCGEYELGFVLHPDHWGYGYALEATRAVVRHVFESLDVSCVIAYVRISNVRSISTLAKLGFIKVGSDDRGDGIERRRYELTYEGWDPGGQAE